MKKTRKIELINAYATTRNEREKELLSIVEDELKRIRDYWIESEDWRKSFEEDGIFHWMFQQLGGKFSAMFYLGMIEEPITFVDVYSAIEGSVEMCKQEES